MREAARSGRIAGTGRLFRAARHLQLAPAGRFGGRTTRVKDMFSAQFFAQLREFEGFFPQPYVCPAGKATIGYGTNLEALPQYIPHADLRLQAKAGILTGLALVRALKTRGMTWTHEQAEAAMREEITAIHTALEARCAAYRILRERGDTVRAEALLDMAYNMGVGRAPAPGRRGSGLLGFHATLPLIERAQYRTAAENLQKSLWYKQVGRRARTICAQLASGQYGAIR